MIPFRYPIPMATLNPKKQMYAESYGQAIGHTPLHPTPNP